MAERGLHKPKVVGSNPTLASTPQQAAARRHYRKNKAKMVARAAAWNKVQRAKLRLAVARELERADVRG